MHICAAAQNDSHDFARKCRKALAKSKRSLSSAFSLLIHVISILSVSFHRIRYSTGLGVCVTCAAANGVIQIAWC